MSFYLIMIRAGIAPDPAIYLINILERLTEQEI